MGWSRHSDKPTRGIAGKAIGAAVSKWPMSEAVLGLGYLLIVLMVSAVVSFAALTALLTNLPSISGS